MTKENNLAVGLIIRNNETGNEYAIIHVSVNQCALCLRNSSKYKINIFIYSTDLLLSELSDGKFEITGKINKAVDVEKLTPKEQATYKRNKYIVEKICDAFGPTFVDLMGRKPKPVINQLITETGLKRQSIKNLIKKYLENGCSSEALLDKRGGSKANRVFKSKTGRPVTSSIDSGKNLTPDDYKNFEEALNKLRNCRNHTVTKVSVYNEMIQKHYSKTIENSDNSVSLVPFEIGKYPNVYQFYNYIRKHMSNAEFQRIKTTAREYDNNHRALIGSERAELTIPGEICDVDATPTDYYLVSKYNPDKVIGRAIMYLIVDVLTGMILSGSLSFEDNSTAAITYSVRCLRREDRDRLLEETGYRITDESIWPTNILPHVLRSDRGVEFTKKFAKMCMTLGIRTEKVPAAEGSKKGTIEQLFREFNVANQSVFENKGMILKRHDSSHKIKACMTLDDMKKVMISFIIFHNEHVIKGRDKSPERIIKGVKNSPQELWKFYSSKNSPRLMHMPYEEFLWDLMPEATASLTRKGILYKGLYYYAPNDKELNHFMLNFKKTEKIKIRYDENDVGHIYYLQKGNNLMQAELKCESEDERQYFNMTVDYYNYLRKQKKDQEKIESNLNIQARINQNERLEMIKDSLPNNNFKVTSQKDINLNRAAEKELDNREHSFSKALGLSGCLSTDDKEYISKNTNEKNNEKKIESASYNLADISDDDSEESMKKKLLAFVNGDE